MPPRLTNKQINQHVERGLKQGWLRRDPRKHIPRSASVPSVLEQRMMDQLDRNGIRYVTQHRFCERRWKFDFAIGENDLKIAVEVEGGLHSRGRHVRPEGFRKDAAKYRRAAILGWLLLRVTSKDITDGSAIADILKAIEVRTLA